MFVPIILVLKASTILLTLSCVTASRNGDHRAPPHRALIRQSAYPELERSYDHEVVRATHHLNHLNGTFGNAIPPNFGESPNNGSHDYGTTWTALRRRRRAISKNLEAYDATLATTSKSDVEAFRELLKPIMVRRIPGSSAHAEVRKHIVGRLREYGFSSVWEHKSKSSVPKIDFNIRGQEMEFTNLVATYDTTPGLRRLVFACHYDSKYFNAFSSFVGAMDSAVPCAMLLDMARRLAPHLRKQQQTESNGRRITLQLVFFDGEEAFGKWSDTDSLYGSRALAADWEKTGELASIDAIFLLDLLGVEMGHCDSLFDASRGLTSWLANILQQALNKCPRISSHFSQTQELYDRMLEAQQHLRDRGLFVQHAPTTTAGGTHQPFAFKYLESAPEYRVAIADDHVPFLKRGVKIVHAISHPFPVTWHTDLDNRVSLHWPTILNLNSIFRLVAADYLGLPAVS